MKDLLTGKCLNDFKNSQRYRIFDMLKSNLTTEDKLWLVISFLKEVGIGINFEPHHFYHGCHTYNIIPCGLSAKFKKQSGGVIGEFKDVAEHAITKANKIYNKL